MSSTLVHMFYVLVKRLLCNWLSTWENTEIDSSIDKLMHCHVAQYPYWKWSRCWPDLEKWCLDVFSDYFYFESDDDISNWFDLIRFNSWILTDVLFNEQHKSNEISVKDGCVSRVHSVQWSFIRSEGSVCSILLRSSSSHWASCKFRLESVTNLNFIFHLVNVISPNNWKFFFWLRHN